MSNSIFFNLGLKETASGVLKKFGTTARGVFGGVDKDVDKTRRKLHELEKPVKVKVDTSEVRRAKDDMDRLGSKLDRLGGRPGSGGLGGSGLGIGGVAIGSMLAQGVMSAGRAAVSMIGDVLGAGMEGGQQKAQFEVLAGKKEGGALFGDLTKYIQDSVFGNSIYANASGLLGFGEDAKNMMGDLKMLADVSMGQEQKMNTLGLVYGQTMAAGKLTGGDLLQYIGVGFNPLQEISRTTGKSYASLREEMEAGKITFGMVKDAFKSATSEGGRFNGMMAQIEKTTFGKKQAQMGNIDAAKMQLGTALDPALGRILDSLKVNFTDRLPAMIDRIAPGLDRLFSKVEEFIPYVMEIGASIGEVLEPIGTMMIGEHVAQLGKNFMGLSVSLMTALSPAVESVTKAMSGLAGIVNLVVDFLKLAKPIWDAVKSSYNFWNKMFSTHPDGMGADYDRAANDAFNIPDIRRKLRGPMLPQVPKSMGLPGASAQMKPDAAATAAAVKTSDSIVSGGRKVINVHIKNVVETINNVGATAEDRAMQTEQQLKMMITRIFTGLPA